MCHVDDYLAHMIPARKTLVRVTVFRKRINPVNDRFHFMLGHGGEQRFEIDPRANGRSGNPQRACEYVDRRQASADTAGESDLRNLPTNSTRCRRFDDGFLSRDIDQNRDKQT